jgi:hypothetical protein
MFRKNALGVLLLAGYCVAACGSTVDQPAGDIQPLPLPTHPLSVTQVTLHPDGTNTVVRKEVTPGSGISVEALTQIMCRGSNFALYDYQVGGNGDDICFTGVGQASLGSFIDYGTTTWAGQVQSYNIFSESDGGTPASGYFSESSDGYSRCETFTSHVGQQNVTYVVDGIGVVNYVRNDVSSCPTISCMSGYFPCNYTCYGQESSECVPDSDCSGCDMEQWNSYCHTLLCTL